MSETPDPWIYPDAPITSAIFATYYEKEGRSAEDGERDLWLPVRALELALQRADALLRRWLQPREWRTGEHDQLIKDTQYELEQRK